MSPVPLLTSNPHSRRTTPTLGRPALSALVAVVLCSWAGPSRPAEEASSDRFAPWRITLLAAAPKEEGCFRAKYPSAAWERTECPKVQRPPVRPPRPGARASLIVGGSTTNDWAAHTSGAILNATGRFSKITGLSQITDICPTGSCACSGSGDGPGSYSLQMNTNWFKLGKSSAGKNLCPSGDNCQVYQQFYYQSIQGSASISMETWIENVGSSCPAGPWILEPVQYCDGSITNYCFLQAPYDTDVPVVSAADLKNAQLVGGFSGKEGGESAYVSFYMKGDDQIMLVNERLPEGVNLYPGWTTAEFNIFGAGNESVATANSGASLTAQVNIALADGSETLPACLKFSGTAEENSLNLISPCCQVAGPAPGILVFESNVSGATSPCQCGRLHTWDPTTASCQVIRPRKAPSP
jgi:hypothetical protein